MFKKVFSNPDDEFTIRLEEDYIDADEDDTEQPDSYVYLHLENRFSDSLGWLCIEDAIMIRDNLSLAIAVQQKKNKSLGWK
jgi:hypothetical protein